VTVHKQTPSPLLLFLILVIVVAEVVDVVMVEDMVMVEDGVEGVEVTSVVLS